MKILLKFTQSWLKVTEISKNASNLDVNYAKSAKNHTKSTENCSDLAENTRNQMKLLKVGIFNFWIKKIVLKFTAKTRIFRYLKKILEKKIFFGQENQSDPPRHT